MRLSISSLTATLLAGSLVSLAAPATPSVETVLAHSHANSRHAARATPTARYNGIGALHGSLDKRDSGTYTGLATHNATWPGVCGYQRNDADFVVALNSPLWNDGANCFRNITIEANGKQITAMITDRCGGCPDGGLDLSPSLFQEFATLNLDVIAVHYYGTD